MVSSRGLSSVSDVTVTPYKNIVCLLSGYDTDSEEDPSGSVDTWYGGTGFYVYSNLFLTAGHNVYNMDLLLYASTILIYRYQNASSLGSTYYATTFWYVPAQFTVNLNPDYDWAIIRSTSAASTSWFGYSYTSSSITNKSVASAGYPGIYSYYMKSTSGTMSSTSAYQFSSTLSCYEGQSGSPVYDSNYIVWGELQSRDSNYNGLGCRITSSIYSMIEALK